MLNKKQVKRVVLLIIMLSIFLLSGCQMTSALVFDSKAEPASTASLSTTATSGTINPTPESTPRQPYIFDPNNPDYREAMRQWVVDIGTIARERDNDFILLPQNCSPLFTYDGEADGVRADFFLESINGINRESLCFGYHGEYGAMRPISYRNQVIERLNIAIDEGLAVLSIDYCSDPIKKAIANDVNQSHGYIGYCAESRSLRELPETTLYENDADIFSLTDAQNFLCILNPDKFDTRADYIDALCQTNYDVFILDAYFESDHMLTAEDVQALKTKANGGKRLVIAYLSVGEAENYRPYWQNEWNDDHPDWLLDANPNWPDNYIVKYWDDEWQSIIARDDNSYLNQIIDVGFDGIFMDIVDGYANFEE